MFWSKTCRGRGRSLMLSDFLVCHPSGPFLTLSQTEFEKAVQKYPSLKEDHGVNYIENSASTSIQFGIGTKCKIGRPEYTDENGDLQLILCHFENGPNVGKTKGLLELAKDLNVNVPAGCLLPKLRDLLSVRILKQ
ncbi:unnamed protein product [Didymodactylos carnosus]|uniref:Uncharacterized protein n=1 Tax=Didymodactylos carnosus TaxID=1234261 RepID=A0A8S2GM40_9BILA|nr:unnamed protein product [Didymodactylos carnosus]CAF3533942.1 unnamed protein product [Didymodactylos carnosus]